MQPVPGRAGDSTRRQAGGARQLLDVPQSSRVAGGGAARRMGLLAAPQRLAPPSRTHAAPTQTAAARGHAASALARPQVQRGTRAGSVGVQAGD